VNFDTYGNTVSVEGESLIQQIQQDNLFPESF
jgi:hypothetical protein